jgi:hypothetical protein
LQPIPELKRPTPEEFRSGARRRLALSRLIPAAAAARVTLPVTDKARMNIAAWAIVQPSRRMRRWLVRESLWCIRPSLKHTAPRTVLV